MTTEISHKRLTAKQEAFCCFYDVLKIGALAAEKAGYSKKAARIIASDLLTLPNIQARLAELKANHPPDPDIADVEERKRRLTHHIRAELPDFVSPTGEVTLSKDIPHYQAAGEFSITEGKYGTRTAIKLRDPIAAIAELNKMERIGAVDSTVNINVPVVIVSAIPRPEYKVIDGNSNQA